MDRIDTISAVVAGLVILIYVVAAVVYRVPDTELFTGVILAASAVLFGMNQLRKRRKQ